MLSSGCDPAASHCETRNVDRGMIYVLPYQSLHPQFRQLGRIGIGLHDGLCSASYGSLPLRYLPMSLNPGLAKDWTKSGQICITAQWRQPASRLGGESAKQLPSSRFAFNTSAATWLGWRGRCTTLHAIIARHFNPTEDRGTMEA